MTDLQMLRDAARLMRASVDSRWSAVADWLEAEADLHATWAASDSTVRAETDGAWELRLTGSTLPQALAVARAYLRREP